MSLLGFDALGRWAIGQLPSGNNAALIAVKGSFALTGRPAVFAIGQSSGAVSCGVTGSAVAFNVMWPETVGTYAAIGLATSSQMSLSATSRALAVGSSEVSFGTMLSSTPTSYVVSGRAALSGVVLSSFGGAYAVTGLPSSYSRGLEDWLPRPFDANVWATGLVPVGSWIATTRRSQSWTVTAAPNSAWTAAASQPESWSRE